jgi:predicted LPLAT superfamily acyltransferase
MARPAGDQATATVASRLHGAFLTRFLLFWMRVLPQSLCLLLTRPVTLLIWLLAGSPRRAVQANLAVLRPEFGRWRNALASYQVFLQFGLTYLDRLWHLHFGEEVEWDISERDRFEVLRAHSGGVLVFTVHSGNYDLGAALFARQFGRALHMVRAPERSEGLQELRAAELRGVAREHPLLHIHYNESASHLGLELCQCLQAGEAVAVQGDRVIVDVSAVEMDHAGVRFLIPRGPLVLAQIARVPAWPIFLSRLGRLHYRIHIGKPFCDGTENVCAAEVGRRWLPLLHDFVHAHWQQWFVFEPLLSRAPGNESGAQRSKVPSR